MMPIMPTTGMKLRKSRMAPIAAKFLLDSALLNFYPHQKGIGSQIKAFSSKLRLDLLERQKFNHFRKQQVIDKF
jgi:hypothetical protein